MYWIGTSGYNYPEWKGSFYPPKLPAAKMLAYYAQRFSSVEINYTFYRLPSRKTLEGWQATAPDPYQFTLKAPRRITHDARLQNCDEILRAFCEVSLTLGPKLGVLLFQLPPSFKKNLGVLTGFLDLLPPGTRAAFEFRHPSWLDDEVFGTLGARNLALCVADSETLSTPVVSTADYGYFRLRDEGYGPADVARWAKAIAALAPDWSDTFVYFKHEDEGKGPEFANLLKQELGLSVVR
jgi:uncharacterized protein YecE (DUF72 family)